MRIVIYSPVFYPMIGGLENVALMLAQGLHNLGHEICVVCSVEHEEAEPFEFKVLRKPSGIEFLRCIRWAEVVLQMQVSLKGLWPLLLSPRRLVISHQTWLSEWDRPPTWQHHVKRFICRFASNITCSSAVAAALRLPCQIVPNPYDDKKFRLIPGALRQRDIIFVGRLVSDKGGSLLVEALRHLATKNIFPSITITGKGPEEKKLRDQVVTAKLEQQFIFTGELKGDALVHEMNRHRILVVPSLWPEPFGIVALEGLACGCFVVGSRLGGLSEAIGTFGATFANGDSLELAEALQRALLNRSQQSNEALQKTHLKMHSIEAVSKAYSDVLMQQH